MKGVHKMKVAVSSNGDNLDAQFDPRFGRCAFFLIINPDDMSFEAFENDSAIQGGDDSIRFAQFLSSKGVDAVITGHCGANTVQTLSAGGVEMFAGQAGTVKAVVERFKKGNLKPASEITVDSHFGMGSGTGLGRGGGRGRSMGGGGGQGRVMGMSGSKASIRVGGSIQSKDIEMEDLMQQAT